MGGAIPAGRFAAVIAGAAVVLLLVVGRIGLSRVRPPIEQPLAFNHRLHVEDLGMACTDCHLYAESGVRATIPNTPQCADCHEEPLGESPSEARLVEYVEASKPIPWKKVYWVPEDVYFSHRRHVAIGGIECAACHGDVGSRERPVVRTEVSTSMEACVSCHADNEASDDCVLCHR